MFELTTVGDIVPRQPRAMLLGHAFRLDSSVSEPLTFQDYSKVYIGGIRHCKFELPRERSLDLAHGRFPDGPRVCGKTT